MYIRAATRTRLTTSLFSTTFLIAILTVAAPQLFGCPAAPSHLDADGKKKKTLGGAAHGTLDALNEQQSKSEWTKKSILIVDRTEK